MSSPVAARGALPAPRLRFSAALGSSLGPLLGLAVVFSFFALWAGPPFYSWYNQVTVLTQSVIVAAGALGMTWIIIAGGIDLSVGSIIALSTVVIARLLQAGVAPLASALAGVAMGGLCGLAAALLFGRIGLAPLSAGLNLELQVIAAIIVGGVGLFGGSGTVFGSFIGVLIISMITSGLILMGVSQYWDGVATGAVILVAVGLNLVIGQTGLRRLAEA
jgi:ribose/xylose/arabinose/galactoside ABC-type transport system permease subunit